MVDPTSKQDRVKNLATKQTPKWAQKTYFVQQKANPTEFRNHSTQPHTYHGFCAPGSARRAFQVFF